MKTFGEVLKLLQDKNTDIGKQALDFLNDECTVRIETIITTEANVTNTKPVTMHIVLSRPAQEMRCKKRL